MTFAKASALVLALAGAMALGVWIGPSLTERWPADQAAVAADSSSAEDMVKPAVATKSRAPAAARDTTKRTPRATRAPRVDAKPAPTAAMPPSTPELQQRLKPLLNRGADMTIASEGFRDGSQFAAVAHAARNTEIPFMVLKHRVVTEGKTLAKAIRESRPELNAEEEASRARAAATADLAAIGN